MINITEELKRINIEDFIWYIYIFIIAFNIYSNYLEKEYVKTKNPLAKKKFQTINNNILIIILIIYLYFLYISLKDYNNLKYNDTLKRKKLTTLALLASLLFVIGGAITLYISLNNPEIDEEVGII